MTARQPPVSVVMPVHNAGDYLEASLRSILEQTFRDFELVILDDASTDASTAILQEWSRRDTRIRLFRTEQCLGVVGSSNFVVERSRSPLVARMDADDISHPERLARQLAVMKESDDVVLVGTLNDGIDATGGVIRPRDRWRLLQRTLAAPFPHGSAMFRRESFDSCGGYREACAGWEDNDLFLRMAATGRCMVLSDVLYHYRFHTSSASVAGHETEKARRQALRRRCLEEYRRGGDYGELLSQNHEPLAADYRYSAVMRVWSGSAALAMPHEAPCSTTLKLRLWRRWVEVSPSTFRIAARSAMRARDFAASLVIRKGRAYQWRCE
jgi:glycosyltransferase involved in cell wall biosynthesis